MQYVAGNMGSLGPAQPATLDSDSEAEVSYLTSSDSDMEGSGFDHRLVDGKEP
jgi:hypothetical protein